ncbi:RNA-directed DNA polymerase, eukaryota, reverse transcriptase zinc-binding domain protein [Tanacetum coccineum]|uniref:RNA-directed DNA polymerase, eukaryota, reverse transcriptase zinc-binding domain protein n=1 Tax=Tanacetum coccineum TaxID=301880 RepID=A0ABQ5GCQ4_9ASTR
MQRVVQADRVNFQSRNVGNGGRFARRSSNTQEESTESNNVQKDTGNGNVQRIIGTSSSRNALNVQCYNCNAKGHYARECPKPRVRDSKYFMEQMLLAKKDKVGIQQANTDSMDGPRYDFAFISEVQKPSTSFMNPLYSQCDYEQRKQRKRSYSFPVQDKDASCTRSTKSYAESETKADGVRALGTVFAPSVIMDRVVTLNSIGCEAWSLGVVRGIAWRWHGFTGS